MKPKIYNEFKVLGRVDKSGRFVIDEKTPTKRGQVSIHEHEAELLNSQARQSHLWYEEAKTKAAKPEIEGEEKIIRARTTKQ